MSKSRLIDLSLITTSASEFLLEAFLKFIYPSKYQQKNIIEILSIFELLKFFLRCRKMELNQFRKIFISERIEKCALSSKPSDFEEIYKFEWKEINGNIEIHSLKTSQNEKIQCNILKLLDSNEENNCTFNQEYEELYPRTKKIVKQISTLPIPEEMFVKNKNKEAENIKIWLGEILYIFRPVLYCFSLIFFRYSSYKPYFISMVFDILRLILQRNITFHWKIERNEFTKRNYDLLFNYLFRNPIYSKIIKGKFLNVFLNKIFRNLLIIKKILFWIVELRLSFCFLM